MSKIDSIARRILGWKLNRADRWFDFENNAFIHASEFQPEQNLEHANIIVERLEKVGFTLVQTGDNEVCLNDIKANGKNLAEAITNAAYSLIEKNTYVDSSKLWQKLC